jgi:hypothetical protein
MVSNIATVMGKWVECKVGLVVWSLAFCGLLAACSSNDSMGGSAGSSGAKAAAGKGGSSATKPSSAAGTGGSSVSVRAGSAGKGSDSADAGPPFVPTGDPVKAPDATWTWVDVPGSKCRDGSMAGFAVNLKSGSKKLMIYLEGGGACFDALTCGSNPANATAMKAGQSQGVLNRTNAENPVKDWNFVYVPYCTGDVHLGTKDDGMILGVAGTQHFVGRLNLEAYLQRIVPTFPDLDQVLLTGVSAGGFGASANAEYVQWAFGDVPLTMIDDSGPPMDDKYLPPCLQDQWRKTWGLDGSVLKDCGADCPDPSNYEMDYTKHIAQKSKGRLVGLIESNQDSVITLFYGYGTKNCTGNFLTPVPGATFTQGLLDLRAALKTFYPEFGTYYITSTQHTWIGGGSFYNTTVGGVRMVDWFTNIVTGKSADAVGP